MKKREWKEVAERFTAIGDDDGKEYEITCYEIFREWIDNTTTKSPTKEYKTRSGLRVNAFEEVGKFQIVKTGQILTRIT